MTPTQALIEAAEAYTDRDSPSIPFAERVELWRNLQAAISSAKAAEEGVETKYVVEVRCPKKYGPNWDSEFGSLGHAQQYVKKTHDAYYVCSIIAVETRRFEVREKEGL